MSAVLFTARWRRIASTTLPAMPIPGPNRKSVKLGIALLLHHRERQHARGAMQREFLRVVVPRNVAHEIQIDVGPERLTQQHTAQIDQRSQLLSELCDLH